MSAMEQDDWRSKIASDEDFSASEAKQHDVLKSEVWSLLRKMGVSRNRLDSSSSSSSTAEIACFMRHLAHLNPHLPAGDSLAVHFLHEEHKFVAQSASAAEMICEVYDDVFPGLFGHVAARTQVYDSIVAKQTPNVEQVVILGAGFDSRAYRMPCLSESSRPKGLVIFEVDAPGTQSAKRIKLREAGLSNSLVTYVPVNFESENFADKLLEAGFDKQKRTLWTWEFVAPYLTPEAVSNTVNEIHRVSKKTSMFAFDYCYKNYETYHGGAGLHRAVVQSGEAIFWTLGPGSTMKRWLMNHGFQHGFEFGPKELETQYLVNKKTGRSYRSFGFYAIVLAKCIEKTGAELEIDEIEHEEVPEQKKPMAAAPSFDDGTEAGGGIGGLRKEILALLERHTDTMVEPGAYRGNLIESSGLDSLQAVAFANDINKKYNVDITETFILNPQTSVDSLTEHIAIKAGVGQHLDASADIRMHIIELLESHTETTIPRGDASLMAMNLIEGTGLDSLQAVALAKDVSTAYGVEVNETLILNPSTSIDSLVAFVAGKASPSAGAAHNAPAGAKSRSDVGDQILKLIERHTETELHDADVDKNLIESTGLDSLQAVALTKDLHALYDVDVTEAFILNPTTTLNSLIALVMAGMKEDTSTASTVSVQEAYATLKLVEQAMFKSLAKRIGSEGAGECMVVKGDESLEGNLPSGHDATRMFEEIAAELKLKSVPKGVHSRLSTSAVVLLFAEAASTTRSSGYVSGTDSYRGIYLEPLLRRSSQSSPGLIATDDLPPVSLGLAQKLASHWPRAFGSVKELLCKTLCFGRRGIVDADEATANLLGWSTNDVMSWNHLENDSRMLLFPDIGMEIDFPYDVDVAKMVDSLKQALAFFPSFGCRLAQHDGRIVSIRGERTRESGVLLSTRRYSRGAKPLLQDMFTLEERKMVPGDSKQPWYGQKSILVLGGGDTLLRAVRKLYWLHLVATQKPFVSHGAMVDIMTGMPVPAGDSGKSRTGTRMTIAVNHVISDAYGMEMLLHIWSGIHRSGIGSVLEAMSPRVDKVTERIGVMLMAEEAAAAKQKRNLSYGMEGLIYAISNDAKASGFKGVLKQKSLDELRAILPEEKRERIPDADLTVAWLWMMMVNSSAKHWKRQTSADKWMPSVCFGKSLRYLFPELLMTTGNIMRHMPRFCPLEDGITRPELDSLLPLSHQSPLMVDVILRLNAERKTSFVRAMETAKNEGKLPGSNIMDVYCYEEDRELASTINHPTLYLNDMSAFSNEISFEADKDPGHVFFSTEGLVGKMGIHGDFDNGCLSLAVNKHLFSESKEYKHAWFVQFACNPPVGVSMNVLLSHNHTRTD